MSTKILIVDDEKEIADLVELYLKNEFFSVYKFYSAKEALKYIKNNEVDLAILDVMLPDGNGFELCKEIRSRYSFPVIMLTAKEEEIDTITGLTLGADDYITKPFRPLELIARVKAQIRRYKKYNLSKVIKSEAILSHKGLTINIKTHECFIDGEEIQLTPTEFEILKILIERKGNVVTSEELFKIVWKDEYFNKNNNTIPTHIRHLREKMNDYIEKPKYIKTVWGVGYKIEK